MIVEHDIFYKYYLLHETEDVIKYKINLVTIRYIYLITYRPL